MCCSDLPKLSNIFLLKSTFKFPVGRVNCLKPLGHCGHFKLHAVVGSIDTAMGVPQCIGRFNKLDR